MGSVWTGRARSKPGQRVLLRREQSVGPGGDRAMAECSLGGDAPVAWELCGAAGSRAQGGVGWGGPAGVS